MSSSQHVQIRRSRRSARASRPAMHAAALTVLLALALAATAIAASGSLTLGSSTSSMLGERVLVNPKGMTLYSLSPETPKHLLCTSHKCLKSWPPVTVPSRQTKLKAGSGVHGRLAIVRRKDGLLQVTVRGLPLYRFAGDDARGEANGQGLESFGGVWHAVAAAGTASPTMPSTPTPTMPTPTPTPLPGY